MNEVREHYGGDEREKQQTVGEDKLTDHHSKIKSQKSTAQARSPVLSRFLYLLPPICVQKSARVS